MISLVLGLRIGIGLHLEVCIGELQRLASLNGFVDTQDSAGRLARGFARAVEMGLCLLLVGTVHADGLEEVLQVWLVDLLLELDRKEVLDKSRTFADVDLDLFIFGLLGGGAGRAGQERGGTSQDSASAGPSPVQHGSCGRPGPLSS